MPKANVFQPPLPQDKQRYVWKGLEGASLALAIFQAMQTHDRPMLIVAEDSLSASHLIDEIHFFSTKLTSGEHSRHKLWYFPDWETLPYDHFSPHQDIISDRLTALYHLPQLEAGAIITTTATLMHRLPPNDFLASHSFIMRVGEKINLDILRTRLAKVGYRSVSQVREHGEFAVRGSIIDLYPMGSKLPFRIDLFDNEVDTIRFFSPETQRSQDKIDEIRLLPAKEFPLTEESIDYFRQAWRHQFSGNPLHCPTYQDISEGIYSPGIEYYLPLFFETTHTLFDYLPTNTLIIKAGDIQRKSADFWREVTERYDACKHDISRPLLPPAMVFLNQENFNKACNHYPQVLITGDHAQACDFNTTPLPDITINHQTKSPLNQLHQFIDKSIGRLLFTAETLGRREVLLQLFKTIDLKPQFFTSWEDFLKSEEKYGMVVAPLELGFELRDPPITVIPEAQLYGKRVMQRRLRKKAAIDPDALIRDLSELQPGDPVVHIDHGIGRYRGLSTLNVGNEEGEFLLLEYQGNDKLYVPVASLHLVSRYTGADSDVIPINKLGTDHWSRTKKKAAEKVRDAAAELLDLYAKRAARPGNACQPPDEQYEAFAASFPFEETPDQQKAIDQVFNDMTSDKPMDRVICGDVGFGKTEVALRAAFLAVQNNKQVAILVPTTLLAQQHYQNFQDRFAEWPIQVGLLSRFRTAKEQKTTLTRMAEGKVDIIIGTHKLLQSDIKFKDLGLVIIDEEHRFGVKQKEKLKALRAMVDILTLTATPIPRTLNMALAGIRDLSVIATPPSRRMSVKTFVHEYQDNIIQEAIQREIMRGGQVYFLHNEVTSISKQADKIKKLVPEARTSVAHGQMHERELERVMSEFYHRHANVLVCSTIIESGIDVPTANTIIINRADRFGIAQLHQLRGRVGRSHHQAYAYLLAPTRDELTADATKRLDAIASLDDLGIGFTLATHDLEIRGAGELLGEEQSGDMQAIGFTLYMDLLSRAVVALKEGKEIDLEPSLVPEHCDIDLHLPALIPENYIYDVQMRLQFYKRIANTQTVNELDDIQVEMIDRFGLIPQPLKNLFAITEIKQMAKSLGIKKIEAHEQKANIEFNDKPNVKPETIISLIQQKSQQFKMDGPTRLRITLPAHEKMMRCDHVKDVLNMLSI